MIIQKNSTKAILILIVTLIVIMGVNTNVNAATKITIPKTTTSKLFSTASSVSKTTVNSIVKNTNTKSSTSSSSLLADVLDIATTVGGSMLDIGVSAMKNVDLNNVIKATTSATKTITSLASGITSNKNSTNITASNKNTTVVKEVAKTMGEVVKDTAPEIKNVANSLMKVDIIGSMGKITDSKQNKTSQTVTTNLSVSDKSKETVKNTTSTLLTTLSSLFTSSKQQQTQQNKTAGLFNALLDIVGTLADTPTTSTPTVDTPTTSTPTTSKPATSSTPKSSNGTVQCTTYVKSRTAGAAAFSGNAATWDDSAKAAGYNVTTTPKEGTIGVYEANQNGAGGYGHVVYVEKVYSDGSMLVSESNWSGNKTGGTRVIQPGSGLAPTEYIEI